MKRYLTILSLVIVSVLSSCTHKELCVIHREHAHKFHVNVVADYRCDWEDPFGDMDWKTSWPTHYRPYDELRPSKPQGLRVVNNSDEFGSNTHNISADGGVINLYEGFNDLLFYNNDTEYIIFSRTDHGVTTRATTRTRTRSTHTTSKYSAGDEETMTPPDVLFANYFEDVTVEKSPDPEPLPVTLQPLVFTYMIRYEFKEGLEYVTLARGALSGMARSVLLSSGETSEDRATLLYDCELTDYGAVAFVNSFGLPGFPNVNYPTKGEGKNALTLELMLRSGKMMTFDYDVSDQLEAQPHGGVIVVSDIVVKREDGAQSTGAFDVDVNDWGPYEDVILPLM